MTIKLGAHNQVDPNCKIQVTTHQYAPWESRRHADGVSASPNRSLLQTHHEAQLHSSVFACMEDWGFSDTDLKQLQIETPVRFHKWVKNDTMDGYQATPMTTFRKVDRLTTFYDLGRCNSFSHINLIVVREGEEFPTQQLPRHARDTCIWSFRPTSRPIPTGVARMMP